mmetsp:Transcript_9730/g.15555  ORF Transcript_9730/g.15555 Transcript_9730/m.15555 type:complete len:87 (-) Transcript_9730:785-1045(-)
MVKLSPLVTIPMAAAMYPDFLKVCIIPEPKLAATTLFCSAVMDGLWLLVASQVVDLKSLLCQKASATSALRQVTYTQSLCAVTGRP